LKYVVNFSLVNFLDNSIPIYYNLHAHDMCETGIDSPESRCIAVTPLISSQAGALSTRRINAIKTRIMVTSTTVAKKEEASCLSPLFLVGMKSTK
jgi:hypothetical protein